MSLPPEERLRRIYRQQRYLDHLTESDLRRRFVDIFANNYTLNNEGKISPHSLKGSEGKYWMTIFTHILEEFTIRYGPYPNGFGTWVKEQLIVKPMTEISNKLFDALNKYENKKGYFLVKYGQKEFLENALETGVLRICPATFYKDPTLNCAIQDDETEFTIHPNPKDFNLEDFDKITESTIDKVEPMGTVKITYNSPVNYYVYCLSNVLTPRLFKDFDANACLLISNPKRFIMELLSNFESKMAKWFGFSENVRYLDPVFARGKDINYVFEIKHFRYAYQKEYRTIWLPEEIEKELKPVNIKLVGLKDYCELITI